MLKKKWFFVSIIQYKDRSSMKKGLFYIIISILCTAFLYGCQSTMHTKAEAVAKVMTPQTRFLDENIEVIHEQVETNVDRGATNAGRTASLPTRFWKKFAKGFQGVSDENPYDRPEPYFRKDFQRETLAASKKGITQPEYLRGERYAKAYRSPFIFREELERGGTTEMTTVAEAGASLLAKQYLDFQKQLEDDLARAEALHSEGKYSEALEIIDRVMDLDSSSRDGRLLFEKVIKAREEQKRQQENDLRERVEKNERTAAYVSEAKQQFALNNYDEAKRIAEKALSVDASHPGAREIIDTVELAQFEAQLKREGTSSLEVLENMIYKHLNLYQQYSKEQLDELAKKELHKVSILETYKDKISELEHE